MPCFGHAAGRATFPHAHLGRMKKPWPLQVKQPSSQGEMRKRRWTHGASQTGLRPCKIWPHLPGRSAPAPCATSALLRKRMEAIFLPHQESVPNFLGSSRLQTPIPFLQTNVLGGWMGAWGKAGSPFGEKGSRLPPGCTGRSEQKKRHATSPSPGCTNHACRPA